ncbi:hypothetical protein FOHLNKBM_6044 [Methylobacterium longum]|nr:hypothetical protein FOHLNKBM_6044 [Methylobacterium longum]
MAVASLLCLIVGGVLTGFTPNRRVLHLVLEATGLILIVLGLVSLPG